MRSCKGNNLKAGYIWCGVNGFKGRGLSSVGGCALPDLRVRGFCRSGKAQPPTDIKKASAKAGLFNATVGRLFQTGSVTQQGGFVGFFPWEMFATKVTVCSGFFVDWVQQIQHLNQAVWTQVEELAHQQGQLF